MSTLRISKLTFVMAGLLIIFEASADGRLVRSERSEHSDVIANHTLHASSDSNFDLVPLSDVYKYIFITILGHPDLMERLSREDQEIVRVLPDHHDERFLEPEIKRFRTTCQEILNRKDSLSAAAIAAMYSNIAERNQMALNRHYQEVLSSLSDSALDLVEEVHDEVSGTKRITHSSVDFEGLSTELPEFVRASHIQSCERTLTLEPNVGPAHLTDIFQRSHPRATEF